MTSDRKASVNLTDNPSGFERSCCPITNGLDIFGDKWTLLIIRDLMLGKRRRYQDLISSPENIASNILADRLKRLQLAGLIDRRAYQQNPARYGYCPNQEGERPEACAGSHHRMGQKVLSRYDGVCAV